MNPDLKEAVAIINALIRAINTMPIFWGEFIGEKLERRVIEFMKKQDPRGGWEEYEEKE